MTAPERPVVNTSPLVFLSKANMLDLLQLVGDEIIVPRAVANEIDRRSAEDVTRQAVNNTPWLIIVDTIEIPAVIQAWDLGQGESSVLAWAAAHPGSEVIIDDLAARRCAATLGISVRGTLGLVLTAKKRGRIPAARPVVETLRQSGMYLSDTVIRQALALVDE